MDIEVEQAGALQEGWSWFSKAASRRRGGESFDAEHGNREEQPQLRVRDGNCQCCGHAQAHEARKRDAHNQKREDQATADNRVP